MAKGKDFFGDNVTQVIAKACKEFSAPQEELNIEVLETGSAGIFGLCKKKARIRVTRKQENGAEPDGKRDKVVEPVVESAPEGKADHQEDAGEKEEKKTPVSPENGEDAGAEQKDQPQPQPESDKKAKQKTQTEKGGKGRKKAPAQKKKTNKSSAASDQQKGKEPTEPREVPSDEVLASIQEDIVGLLEVMKFPSDVTVELVDSSVACRISEEHQDDLVGSEGRTLDSLQYLLRKMMARRLPDRMMLSLDVGDYRERRIEELKEQAATLAEQVKEDGKTQAIPALNPSERRVVHMILQEDKAIRSRSVGEGLFKKVLIYKPGKKKRPPSRKGKGKGRPGGRSPKKGE